jgi:hypothetical protein
MDTVAHALQHMGMPRSPTANDKKAISSNVIGHCFAIFGTLCVLEEEMRVLL